MDEIMELTSDACQELMKQMFASYDGPLQGLFNLEDDETSHGFRAGHVVFGHLMNWVIDGGESIPGPLYRRLHDESWDDDRILNARTMLSEFLDGDGETPGIHEMLRQRWAIYNDGKEYFSVEMPDEEDFNNRLSQQFSVKSRDAQDAHTLLLMIIAVEMYMIGNDYDDDWRLPGGRTLFTDSWPAILPSKTMGPAARFLSYYARDEYIGSVRLPQSLNSHCSPEMPPRVRLHSTVTVDIRRYGRGYEEELIDEDRPGHRVSESVMFSHDSHDSRSENSETFANRLTRKASNPLQSSGNIMKEMRGTIAYTAIRGSFEEIIEVLFKEMFGESNFNSEITKALTMELSQKIEPSSSAIDVEWPLPGGRLTSSSFPGLPSLYLMCRFQLSLTEDFSSDLFDNLSSNAVLVMKELLGENIPPMFNEIPLPDAGGTKLRWRRVRDAPNEVNRLCISLHPNDLKDYHTLYGLDLDESKFIEGTNQMGVDCRHVEKRFEQMDSRTSSGKTGAPIAGLWWTRANFNRMYGVDSSWDEIDEIARIKGQKYIVNIASKYEVDITKPKLKNLFNQVFGDVLVWRSGTVSNKTSEIESTAWSRISNSKKGLCLYQYPFDSTANNLIHRQENFQRGSINLIGEILGISDSIERREWPSASGIERRMQILAIDSNDQIQTTESTLPWNPKDGGFLNDGWYPSIDIKTTHTTDPEHGDQCNMLLNTLLHLSRNELVRYVLLRDDDYNDDACTWTRRYLGLVEIEAILEALDR